MKKLFHVCTCIVTFQDECDIDIANNELQTALHIAVHQGHGPIVERLVGFGANLNLQVLLCVQPQYLSCDYHVILNRTRMVIHHFT